MPPASGESFRRFGGTSILRRKVEARTKASEALVGFVVFGVGDELQQGGLARVLEFLHQ